MDWDIFLSRQKKACLWINHKHLVCVSLILKEGEIMYHNLFRITLLGTAIAMITAGIMSLAFMGFAGLDKYK